MSSRDKKTVMEAASSRPSGVIGLKSSCASFLCRLICPSTSYRVCLLLLVNEMLVKRYPNKTPDLLIHRSSAPSAIHRGEPSDLPSPTEAGTPQAACTGKHTGPIERHDGSTGCQEGALTGTKDGASLLPSAGNLSSSQQ